MNNVLSNIYCISKWTSKICCKALPYPFAFHEMYFSKYSTWSKTYHTWKKCWKNRQLSALVDFWKSLNGSCFLFLHWHLGTSSRMSSSSSKVKRQVLLSTKSPSRPCLIWSFVSNPIDTNLETILIFFTELDTEAIIPRSRMKT